MTTRRLRIGADEGRAVARALARRRLGIGVLLGAIVSACGTATTNTAGDGGDATIADVGADGANLSTDSDARDVAVLDLGVADVSTHEADALDAGDALAIGSADATVSLPPLPTGCSQSVADSTSPPATSAFLRPAKPVTPFYQWINNNGYCGEASMIQAGMNNGQWTSQYNARLLCGGVTGASDPPAGVALSQSGPGATCDDDAQLLVNAGAADAAPTCLTNFGLANTSFDSASEASGMAGYESFLSWIKQRTIAGDNVIIGVLDSNGSDDEYDHIVTVVEIGTNHAVTDATYYADDVLYFDDHGLLTFEGGADTNNPGIPPGTGADPTGCTPYVFGYSFGALASTASAAHAKGAHAYSIVIPGSDSANYGVAVSGPIGGGAATSLLPVTLTVSGTEVGATPNPPSPLVGFNYENPIIGDKDDGTSCTNDPPSSWMTVSVDVTVGGLTVGTAYNLYEYTASTVSGIGSAAALAIPTSAWNGNASEATAKVSFVATGPTFTHRPPPFPSDETVVFRAVAATAP